MADPKTLEEAMVLIRKLKTKESKHFHGMIMAKARQYDLLYCDAPEPAEAELKSEVLYLRDELHKVVEMRDALKEELRHVNCSGAKVTL